VAETLDSALKRELHAVLGARPVTEAELRRLFEDGRACALILAGQLEKEEQRLTRLSGDPAAPFTELAAALRRVNELRPDLEELRRMLDELDAQARELRASWVSAS
jgi:chromosome segregation ATPase